MTTILWVNKETNIVENSSIDDRPFSEITLPNEYLALDRDTTSSVLYLKNKETGEIDVIELIGQGGIGFTWDGTKLLGPQPKPL